MDESSDSRFWPFLARLFRNKSEARLEDIILEAVEAGEVKKDEEVTMLLNVLRLGRKKVYEVMVPRTDMIFAEDDATIAEVAQSMIAAGHSRIPVYHDNRDQIVGVAHARDLLKRLLDPQARETAVKEILRKPYFIPETKNLKEALQEFRSRKTHLAIIVDEYGGTSGMITFEDVLEEIVGDIEDEHDAQRVEEEDILVLDSNEALVSGRALLEDLEERLDIRLESEEVETVGGYLIELAGRVPEPGEQFALAGRRFTVKAADARQIKQILISPAE